MANKIEDIFRPSEDCPSVEELVLLLDGTRGAPAQQEAEEHVTHCTRCSSELALCREFESAQATVEEQKAVAAIAARLRRDSPVKPEPWWRSIWQPRILTPVSIALAAAAIVMVINVQRVATPHEPSVGTGDVTRSGQVVAIAPLGDIAQVPSELKWQAAPGASRYQVRLLEVDRTEIWNGTASEPKVTLPPSLVAQITPLKRLLWEVTAFDASGRPLGSSGLQSFRILRSD